MAKRTVVIACPKCNTVVNVEYGFFSRTVRCPNPGCGHKIDIKKESMKIVNCPKCRCDVALDALRGGDQTCPNCHTPLNGALPKKFETVRCPYCGQYNDAATEDKTCTCAHCGKSFSIKPEPVDRAVLIEARFDTDYIIWQYRDKDGNPTNRFPIASRLIVPEGMTALLLRNGVCKEPVGPGDYLLSDSRLQLDDQLITAMASSTQQITADIFFVRNQFRNPIAFSDKPVFIDSGDGSVSGKLSLAGEAIVRVANAKLFAEFVGYQTSKEETLVASGSVNESPSKLRVKLRTAAFSGAVQATQELVRRYGWTEKQIELHKEEIQRAACLYINQSLQPVGLEAADITLSLLEYKPDEIWSNIKRYTEQPKRWNSVPMNIHMKDDSTLSATLTLKGTYQLAVEDKNKYMSLSHVEDWMRNGTGEGTVNDFYTTRVNELLKNVLPNVIQSYIDASDADIRELQSHYHRLRAIAEESVGKKLREEDGLGIRSFVMEQDNLALSQALILKTGIASHKTMSGLDLDKYAFDRKMDVEHTAVDMRTSLQKDNLSLEMEISKDKNDALRDQLRSQREARQAGYSVESMDRLHHLQKHELDLKRGDLDDETVYQQKKKLETVANQAELDELSQRARMQAKLRTAEELRMEWEQKRQLEEQQLDEEIRRAEKKQAAVLRSQQADTQARQQTEQSEAENQRILNGIMRRIAESDLELKDKLTAFERLCQNNKALDEMQLTAGMAKAKAEAQYSLEHTRLTLSKEESALMEEMARQAEERDERRKQAEFQRAMQQQETQIVHEMEKLKLQYDQDLRAAELEERLAGQQAEIDKMQIMLDYYAKVSQQNAEARIAIAAADSVRAQAEREYEMKKAAEAREEAQRQERLRNEREDKYSAQAERLLTQMWEIQSAMDKLREETEQKRVEGQTQVDIARAQATGGQDIAVLIRSLEKMVNNLNNDIRRSKRKQQEVGYQPLTPPFPVHTPGPAQGAQTPPEAEQKTFCPKCGKPVSKYSTLCTCGHYLG